MIGVDFTGSNGKPSDPKSLHYRSPVPDGSANQYEQAIMSLGEVESGLCSEIHLIHHNLNSLFSLYVVCAIYRVVIISLCLFTCQDSFSVCSFDTLAVKLLSLSSLLCSVLGDHRIRPRPNVPGLWFWGLEGQRYAPLFCSERQPCQPLRARRQRHSGSLCVIVCICLLKRLKKSFSVVRSDEDS